MFKGDSMYRIIIVDDEEKIREGIANLFPWNAIGFEVAAVFQDGESALSYIRNHPVDVVLTDIAMPVMDGIELIEALGGHDQIKIVLFSSYQSHEYTRAAIMNHVSDYLLKPIKYEQLLECFGRIKAKLDAEKHVSEDFGKSYYEKIVDTVKKYVQREYRDASLDKAAVLVRFHPSYLSRIFKEKAGIGFSDYLLSERMTKAGELLRDMRYKTYEIADRVGYDNPKNFSRAFKAFHGMSPQEYRNRAAQEGSGEPL